MKKQLYTKLLTLLCILGIPMFSMASDFTLSSAATVEKDGITISFAKGSGSNAPAWYPAGLRLYVNNTITISSTGNNISGVTFNWEKQGSKAFVTNVTADPGTYQHPSAPGQGVWSGSAKSITFTLASSGQLQLNTLTVTLETSGGESTKEANDLTLNATEKTFDLKDGDGQTFQLTNSGVADGALSFASNNSAVATVSDAGLITAVGEGTATITVTQAASETYEDGSATCLVTVTDSRYIVSNLTFTDECNGSGTAVDGAAWTVTSDGVESNFDTNRGIHYGTSSNPVQYIKLNSSDFSGIIKKVVVNASTANGVAATVAVTVGGEAFGGDPKTLTTTATDYTFTDSASGEIEVTVTKPSSAEKALYVKSVKVYYTPSPLASIAVDVANAPTTFHLGDDFSHEGAVVTATYENETTKDVTTSATFSTPDMTTVGEKTVTVSYTEGDVNRETTYDINVLAPAVLTGIALSGDYPTDFYVGDEFSHEGMIVTASYDDDSTKDVADEATFTGYDMSAVGDQTVTVSYTDGEVTKTATYDITLSLKPGSEALPYTVAQARAAIDANAGKTGVYVQGIVSEIVTEYSEQYGNISYNISADGTTESDQLQAYRGKSYNGDAFTSADDIKVGDKVVIYGNLTIYGETYEFAAGNQLVSLERASLPEVSITAAANATWVAPAKVKITSTDVKVYTVTYDDAVGCTRKHEVADKVIPANEAVLLTSDDATTVTLENTTDEATDFAALDNDLQGSDGTVQGAANIFCLAVGEKGLGFYPVSNEIYVPAGKAYLLIPATQAAPSYLWFNGDTTAIDSLTTDTAAGNESGEIYSLTGQRVGKNYRGIVIMNGRKVLKK